MTMRAGQIVVQKSGNHKDGTPLIAIVGIVPDLGDFLEHRQYTVIVTESGLSVPVGERGIDLRAELHGLGISNALTLPIWRIG